MRSIDFRRMAAALALAVSAPGAAQAGDRARYTIAFENDFFAGGDEDYTNGLRLSYLSPAGRGEGLARALMGAASEDRTRLAFGAGQSIFSPRSYALPTPPAGQHPYAGWLYADAALIVERQHGPLDQLTLTLGVVGPAALGEQAQRTAHRAFGFVEPRGWDNQLRNEPGAILSFDRLWRPGRPDRPAINFEIAPFAGVSVGNVLTEARAGAVLQVGRNLSIAPDAAWIRPGLPTHGSYGADWSWRLFAVAGGRAVARNIFLDGNTFVDSASVEKNTIVGEVKAGASIGSGRLRLSYAQVWRTREYETQERRNNFGALSLSGSF